LRCGVDSSDEGKAVHPSYIVIVTAV
jgi:hypothetical protein